jgi:hypothetical protein
MNMKIQKVLNEASNSYQKPFSDFLFYKNFLIEKRRSEMKCFKIIACLFFLLVINLTFSIADSSAVCLDPPSGMVSWWPGDGNAFDIIGPNDGTLINGTTFASGKVDQAFSFDGVDDFASASGTNINDLQQLTIDAWVMHNSLPSGQIMRYVTLVGEKAVLRYDGINGPQQLHFYMRIDGVLRHIRVNDVLQVGAFHHVAGTYDGEYMRLYLDGVEVESLAVSGTVGAGTIVNLTEGREPLDGLLDEVEIYNRALSTSEIQAIYDAGTEGKCKTFGDWETVYNTLFDSPSYLELFRQYRDEILSNTTRGVIYKTLLYTLSKQALHVLLSNPNFIYQAKALIEPNYGAVLDVLDGYKGVVNNTGEIAAFLAAYAKKSPPILKILAYIVKWDMLRKQRQGKLFHGFRLK